MNTAWDDCISRISKTYLKRNRKTPFNYAKDCEIRITYFEALIMIFETNDDEINSRWRWQGPPKGWYPTTLHGVTTQKTSNLHTSPWRWRQYGSPKRWYPTTTLHGVTTHKTSNLRTSPWRWRQYGSPKRWNPTTSLHDVTIPNTST